MTTQPTVALPTSYLEVQRPDLQEALAGQLQAAIERPIPLIGPILGWWRTEFSTDPPA